MKSMICVVGAMLVLGTAAVQAGPFGLFGGCPNCWSGFCGQQEYVVPAVPEIEVKVEAFIAPPAPGYEKKMISEAAEELSRGNLAPAREHKLRKIIDAPALRKALRQEYSLGSCGMICTAHGSQLYTVYEDGSVDPAVVSSETVSYTSIDVVEVPSAGTSERGFIVRRVVHRLAARILRRILPGERDR